MPTSQKSVKLRYVAARMLVIAPISSTVTAILFGASHVIYYSLFGFGFGLIGVLFVYLIRDQTPYDS